MQAQQRRSPLLGGLQVRKKRCKNMREMDYNALLVNASDIIGAVIDAKTSEILYMNEAALRTYGLPSAQSYAGKRCYEVLSSCKTPCSDCPLRKMPGNTTYRWEQYNARTKRWYDSTEHILEQDGRLLHIKIAQDVTARKMIQTPVDGIEKQEDAIQRCLHILAQEKDLNAALHLFLEEIARYYQADRAYIFEFDLDRQTMNNVFEWCQEGVSAEIDNLQNVSLNVVREWIHRFETEGEFFITRLNSDVQRDSEAYQILSSQNIDSLLAAPLQQDKVISGFLGVDNPKRQTGDLMMLRSVTEFIRTELEKRRLIQELQYLCYTDTLTGAYNRKKYEDTVKHYPQNTVCNLGVVVVTVNGIKGINTLYGMSYGDKVLCRVCETMRTHLPGEIFRMGGDEFTAFCDGISKDEFQAAVSALRRAFQKREDCPVAIGCAWQCGEIMPETVFSKADDLMYAEKRSYYGDVLRNGKHHTRRGAAEEVLEEIDAGRFVIFFQPQIDFSDQAVFGAEVLVRKTGDDGALIFPDKFIPFYETTGVIRYLDLHVLELTCATMREWADKGVKLRMSVNFSRLTLMEPHIVETIVSVCRKYSIAPEQLTIEVTENIHQMDHAYLRRLVKALKQEKFRISLDDFGSSYSNLAILSAVDFDEIKFDRTLIQDIETNHKSRVVVRNSMRMCEELGGAVSVAEGVETQSQMELLTNFGCKIGQGYYFSRPIPKTAFAALLREKDPFCPV